MPSIAALGALCSVSWEAIAPALLPFSTGDIVDCAMYMLGGVFYGAARERFAKSRRVVASAGEGLPDSSRVSSDCPAPATEFEARQPVQKS